MPEMITITKEDYDILVSNMSYVRCLEAHGLDSWEHHDAAFDEFRKNPHKYIPEKYLIRETDE